MPSGLVDGALVIDTGLDNSEFFRDARAFKAAVQGLKQAVDRVGRDMGRSGDAYLKSIRNDIRANREFRDEIARLESQARRMKDALDKPGRGSSAYKAIEDEIKRVENELEKAKAVIDSMTGPDAKPLNLEEYSKASAEVKDLTARLEELNEQKKQAANPDPNGKEMQEYRERERQYNAVAEKIDHMRQVAAEAGGTFAVLGRNVGAAVANVGRIAGTSALNFLKKLAAGAKNAAIQLAKLSARALSSGLKKLAAYVLGASKGLFGLGKSARSAGGGFQFSLKNLLKYGLGIRSLFVLFNRLRSAIKEGFSALQEQDPRVRAALASLSAALNGLKGSLASAFAPILTAAAPALTTLINLVTQAVNALGMFFAALTGQSYYTAARGISTIGSAASSSSGSVKDLKRQLAGFDELNILSASSSGGGNGGGGSASGMAFEQTPIGAGIAHFVDSMKALIDSEDWDGLGRLFGKKINGALDKARTFISWDNLGGTITKIVNGITGTINGLVAGIDWPNVGATLAEGLNTIVNTMLLWFEGIDWAQLGRSLGEGLNGLISRIDWAHIGDLIRAKLTALLDFTKNFIITFDEVEAARKIREALGRVPWAQLASDFWETAKAAFKKVGNFIYVLLGGEIDNYDISAEDMLAEKLAIRNGRTGGGESWVRRLAQKIGEVIGSIPWRQIFEDAKKVIGDAVGGLIDGLFGTEDGTFLVKLAAAFAGIKLLLPFMFSGLLKTVTGSISLLSSGIVKALDAMGLSIGDAALLAFDAVLIAYDVSSIKRLVNEYNALQKERIAGRERTQTNFESLYDKNPTTAVQAYSSAYGVSFAGMGKDDITKAIGDMYAAEAEGADAAVVFAKNLINAGYSFTEVQKQANLTAEQLAEVEKLTRPAGFWNADVQTNTKDYQTALANTGAKGPNGDYTLRINPEKMDRLTKALGASTKATVADVKQTKKAESSTTRTLFHSKSEALAYATGASSRGTVYTAMRAEGIEVPVNFLPANMTQYLNKPLEWLNKVFAPGTDTDARVQLLKQGWTSIAAFVGTTSPLSALLGLVRNGWSSLTTFVGTNNPISALLGLVKNGWTTLKGYTESNSGGNTMQAVNLSNGWGYKTVNDWVGLRHITGMVAQAVNLTNGWGYNSVNDWVGLRYITNKVAQAVDLRNGWGYSSVNDWVGFKYITGNVVQKVDLVLNKVSGVAGAFKVVAAAGGGILSAGGLIPFAAGGVIQGGAARWWRNVPAYASGTAGAHGSVFVAGEAGPEVVGHINGRTEILNKSQLAQTMQASVYAGMVAALNGITFRLPAMATGGIMPYDVSAQIAKSTADIQGTLDANNEDLIQTIISVAGQIVAALNRQNSPQQVGTGGLTAQQVINEINRQTLMFGASPLKGV